MVHGVDPLFEIGGQQVDNKPHNLQDAIWRKIYLMGSTTKTKFNPRLPLNQGVKDKRVIYKGKGKMDEATRRELRRKKLYFTCK